MICSGGTLHESGNYGNRQGYGGYFGKGFGGLRERKRKRHRGNPIDSAGSFRYDYAGGFGKSHSSL